MHPDKQSLLGDWVLANPGPSDAAVAAKLRLSTDMASKAEEYSALVVRLAEGHNCD